MYNRVGIFTPVYFREELAIKSLETLVKTNTENLEVFIGIGINGASNKYRDVLKPVIEKNNIMSKRFTFIDVYDPGVNFGKPVIINAMSRRNRKYFDYLVSIDSDIQITDRDWLLKMLDVFHQYNTNIKLDDKHKKLAALCANQDGHSVHQAEKLGKISMKLNEYTLISTERNQGVAGGILMTPRDIWWEIGGYRASNIYGSDDGSYAVDCNKMNYLMAYVDEIKCFHPLNEDMDYAEWKVRACNGELKEDEKKGFFEELRGV